MDPSIDIDSLIIITIAINIVITDSPAPPAGQLGLHPALRRPRAYVAPPYIIILGLPSTDAIDRSIE